MLVKTMKKRLSKNTEALEYFLKDYYVLGALQDENEGVKNSIWLKGAKHKYELLKKFYNL